MKVIRGVSQDLARLTKDIRRLQPEHIRSMVQPLHVPLLYCLMEAAGCPDSLDTAARMACGFEAVGDIPPSGWWESDVQPNKRCLEDIDIKEWLVTLEKRVAAGASSPLRAADAAAVRAKTLDEVAAGLMRGPFTKDELDTAYGEGAWFAMHRFGVWQNGKVRGCDNARTSGHNDITAIFERLHLERPDFPARVCAAMAESCDELGCDLPPMRGGTDDLANAYRHVGTNAPNMTVVALGDAEGRTEYYTLPGFNFGLKSAVPQFNRVPEATTAIARRLLGLLVSHYFDDFVTVEPADTCAQAQRLLAELHLLVGFPFQEEKHAGPGCVVTFLGVESHLARAHEGLVDMCVSRKRVDSVVARCEEALAADRLDEGASASLAGKLYFTLAWVAGRLGRACLQPILHQPPHGNLTPASRAALRYLREMIPVLEPRRIQLYTPHQY